MGRTSAPATAVRLFDGAGTPLSAVTVIGNPVPPAWDENPDVVTLANGDYAVVWTSGRVSTPLVYGRIVAADGTPQGSNVMLEATTVFYPKAVAVGNDLVVAWYRSGPLPRDPYLVQFQMFDRSLSPMGPVVTVDTTYFPDLVEIESAAGYPGGFLLTWLRLVKGQTVDTDVYAQYFDSAGNPQGPKLRVNSFLTGRQEGSRAAVDKSGLGLVVWSSLERNPATPSDWGVYAQLLVPPGDMLGGEFQVNTTRDGIQGYRAGRGITVTPSGVFATLWYNTPPQQTKSDIIARRYGFPVSLLAGAGPDPAAGAYVRTFRPMGRPGYAGFAPYASSGYGADVAAGRIDSGKVDALLTGPGPGPVLGPHLRGFHPAGTPYANVSFYAYGSLRYGLHPAAGDTDGDGFAEILTGAGSGAVFGPHVRAFDYDGARVKPIAKGSFFAYGSLHYGVNVGSGDIDGDGVAEVLTAPGPGPTCSNNVKGFKNYRPMGRVNFFSDGYMGGEVAAGDIENDGLGAFGDGYDEIVAATGPGWGWPNRFIVWDYDAAQVKYKTSYTIGPDHYGAAIDCGDVDAGDMDEIAAGPGPDPAAPARLKVLEWQPQIWLNPDPPHLEQLGPDDFTALLTGYGLRIAIGKFE